MFSPVIFFGCYHPGDYVRLFFHFGPKKIFWCGSDILALRKSPWRFVLWTISAVHYCENQIEQRELQRWNIYAKIAPMIFSPGHFPICYEPKEKTTVFMTYHPGREEEYGIDKVKEIAKLFPEIEFEYFAHFPEKAFDEVIKECQAALRLNRFDGFAETLAKSALMGQYPISWIQYPHITHVYDGKSLKMALQNLIKKKEPNYEAAYYWRKRLKESLDEILTF